MNYAKQLAVGGILVSLAVLFQLAPVVLTEVFVPITLLSTAAIYLLSRQYPRAGFAAYMAAAFIIMLISVHEGLFFFCTTGLTGFSLGTGFYFTHKRGLAVLLASFLLASTLSLLTNLLGISVLGFRLPGGIAAQTFILLLVSSAYSSVSLVFLEPLYQFLSKKLL
jgi:hypothetical protein